MAIIALVSAKGSPGVTTTALACALSWHRRLILAECDPAGGSVLAGYLGGALDGPRGIGELAVGELRDGSLESSFWSQLVDLDAPRRERLLLPGVIDPAQAGSVTPLWQRFADFFTGLERGDPPYDVIVDCGRLHVLGPPWPLLRAASVVLVVSRAQLPDLSGTRAMLQAIERDFTEHRVPSGTLRLLLVGGGHGRSEVSKALQLPVIARLPHDPRTAEVLSLGGTVRANRPLLRAARELEVPIGALLERRRARLAWPVSQGVPDAI
ncbi:MULTISPECIES: ParA family protein [unclassified Micromonospora]|uniref:ParA family protein n=1 Tax=unclassified Micromonospora TaxID=2617518 RepID=UPI0022B61328|nr:MULTISPECIES: ParA family protein [unclassified Micromonospora]MCZ7421520.1 ParA family protein [Verrucosispora sp. WMMA2121]WBB93793.1 ParA family protein [Verrucosispora sp. WMMC514]